MTSVFFFFKDKIRIEAKKKDDFMVKKKKKKKKKTKPVTSAGKRYKSTITDVLMYVKNGNTRFF